MILTFISTVAKYFWAAIQQFFGLFGKKGNNQNLPERFEVHRFVCTQQITKTVEGLCQADKPPSLEKPFTAENPVDKPLLILLEWPYTKEKHVIKFGNLYLVRDFDEVQVSLSTWQLIGLGSGFKVVAKDLLNIPHLNGSYQRTIIHGFSTGCNIWAEILPHIHADPEKYHHVMENIVGQVWDSPADAPVVYMAAYTPVFPNYNNIQKFLQKILE